MEISSPEFQQYEWNYPNISTELNAGSGIQGGGLHKSASAPSRRDSGSGLHILKCCHICFFEIIHCHGDIRDILGGGFADVVVVPSGFADVSIPDWI